MEHCYQRSVIQERHRHRYELNNQYRELLTDAGLVISGTSPDGRLAETIELADHPFYILQTDHILLTLIILLTARSSFPPQPAASAVSRIYFSGFP